MSEPSGAAWCERFPTSTSINDLQPQFAEKVSDFIHTLESAGASVHVSATYRPAERAFLMHYCCKIADREILPVAIPKMAGVDIDWGHGGDLAAAVAGARAMKEGYGIAYPAALVSRHTQRLAIDMTVSWKGALTVRDARGVDHVCHAQQDLWPIGASYGVHKLANDAPHWSSDGH